MLNAFLESRKWLVSLFLINLAGFLFGIYYYSYQLSITSPLTWIFIIDCPLYVLLFSVLCLMKLKSKTIPTWLLFLTSVGLVKYGLWTGLVIWLYSAHFFSISPAMYSILFPLHIGMILEGIVLLPHFRARAVHVLPVFFWFLLNDFLDYFASTLPLIPDTFHTFLLWESLAVSILLSLGFAFLSRKPIFNRI